MCLLRGRVYSALENQPRAARWLRQALKLDVQCIEALDLIVDNRMLTTHEGYYPLTTTHSFIHLSTR
jgi:hypothetical protein